jgi:MFS family permease
MLVGIGEAALAPAAVSIIADSFPVQKRGTAFGVFLMGMALGSGASIVVGGFMLQTAINGAFDTLPFVGSLVPWRQVLVLLCIPGFLVTLLILTFKEPERRGTESNNGPLPIKDVAKIFIKYSPVILPLYCAVALASAGDVAFQTWLPSALTRQFHLTPGEIGGTLGILAMLAGAAGAASGGMLSDRTIKHGIRIRILIAVIFILIGLSGAAVVLAKNVPAVLTMFVIWLLTTAISKTIGITLIQEIMPNEARGMASAMVSFFNMIIGLGLGTTMTAVFTDHIYKNPQMVSASISSVAIPAGLLSVYLFLLARHNAKKLAPKE